MEILFDLTKFGSPEVSKDFNKFTDKINIEGLHEIQEYENPYHLFVQDFSINNEYILIGLHGAIERAKVNPPAIFFRGVAKKAGIGLISIADPSINLSKQLNLGWYLGNKINGNVTKEIASLLDKIIEKTGKKLIIAGGSGGGFAALNIHNHMKFGYKAISFVWNPQTDIVKYNLQVLKKYYNVCIEEKNDLTFSYNEKQLIEKNIPYKLSERNDLEQLIFINGYDHAHLRKHVRKYINNTNETKNRVFVGDWGYGHIQPDQETIINVIKSISNNNSLDEVIKITKKPKKPVLDFNKNSTLFEDVINCRVSIIKANPKRIICIKTNIYDHFIGFQTLIRVKDYQGNLVFKSDYLFGADVCELYLNSSIEDIRKLKGAVVEIYVEDIHGDNKTISFSFDKIKGLHECNLKI